MATLRKEVKKDVERIKQNVKDVLAEGKRMLSFADMDDWTPAPVDLRETRNEVIAEIEMPGVDKNDITLEVEEYYIRVKATRTAEVLHTEEKGFVRHERSYQGYYREFGLPARVNPDQAFAEYRDGVLRVTIPKAEPIERFTSRRIAIA